MQGRAFTVAITVPVLGNIVVLNLGATPKEDKVIHELAHAWQSQHHSDPVQFMRNCVSCQAAAVALNPQIAMTDPKVRTDPDFPANFPFSAYGYVPGKPFNEYGGEQIAQQIEKGEAPILAHVKGVAVGAVDLDNVKSLNNNNKIEDLRNPGVKV